MDEITNYFTFLSSNENISELSIYNKAKEFSKKFDWFFLLQLSKEVDDFYYNLYQKRDREFTDLIAEEYVVRRQNELGERAFHTYDSFNKKNNKFDSHKELDLDLIWETNLFKNLRLFKRTINIEIRKQLSSKNASSKSVEIKHNPPSSIDEIKDIFQKEYTITEKNETHFITGRLYFESEEIFNQFVNELYFLIFHNNLVEDAFVYKIRTKYSLVHFKILLKQTEEYYRFKMLENQNDGLLKNTVFLNFLKRFHFYNGKEIEYIAKSLQKKNKIE